MADHSEAARGPHGPASTGRESLRQRFTDMAAIPTIRREGYYIVLLVATALAGQLFASYDFNLLVLTIPNITKSLHLSSTQVGALVFFIYGGEFVITMFAGYAMDKLGRKLVWQFNLVGTAVFTGLTYFVANYTELVVIRTIAGAFAVAEFAMAAVLVSEQTPARARGFLYSIVNGGYALGVLLASAVYSLVIGLGWRDVFAFGVIPLLAIVFARRYLRESERWRGMKEVKEAKAEGDLKEMEEKAQEYGIDLEEVDQPTVRQLLSKPGLVRRQLLLLTGVWFFYASAYVATNVYITYWLTHYAGWTGGEAATLLLVAGGIGFFFYVFGGALGEIFGRKEVMTGAGVLVAPLNLVFYFVSFHQRHWNIAVFLVWFFIFQATNGVWSGAGQGYWPESFPTRVRGTAVGWLGAMFAGGNLVGAGIWTLMIGSAGPSATWLVVGVGLACGQYLTFALKHIDPNQELEDIVV
jgi:MFS family permease